MIDILIDIILEGLISENNVSDHVLTDLILHTKNPSFTSIVAEYTLNVDQSVALRQ